MPFLLAEILNFQGSTHRIGVGSFSNILNKQSEGECTSPDPAKIFMLLKVAVRLSQGSGLLLFIFHI